MRAVKIPRPNGGYLTAGVIDEGVFKKIVQHKKHYCRLYKGWGIDYAVFVTVIKPQCERIVIFDKDNKVIYRTTVAIYERYGKVGEFKGSGRQIFLEIKYFEREKK